MVEVFVLNRDTTHAAVRYNGSYYTVALVDLIYKDYGYWTYPEKLKRII